LGGRNPSFRTIAQAGRRGLAEQGFIPHSGSHE
jgi:hypothetical protein